MTFFRKQNFIVLAAVLLFSAILLSLPFELTSRLKLVISSSFLPLFGVASGTKKLAGAAVNAVTPRSVLITENDRLRHENQELVLKLSQMDAVWKENARLRTQLGWREQQKWVLKPAQLIARDPVNWWRSIQINLGDRDGVRANLPVVTPSGLVGRVTEVAATRSVVTLLGDPNLRVGAMVAETGETGIILSGAASKLDTDMVDLGFLSRHSNLKPGHTVVTSGEGGVFPKWIKIGTIVDYRSKDYGLSVEARVKLASSLSSLDLVWVLFP